jgi:hypothetical protein
MTVEIVDSEESADVGTTPTGVDGPRTSRFPMPPATTPQAGGTSPIGAGSPGATFDVKKMSSKTASLFAMFQAMAAATAHSTDHRLTSWTLQESVVSTRAEFGLVKAYSNLDKNPTPIIV